jgi:hypothetical protein
MGQFMMRSLRTMPEEKHEVLTVTGTARPKRIAVLVDPSAITLDELDEVTQLCITHWGGAYWPIVPCDGRILPDDWWRVLEAVDPDLIYAICDLRGELHDEIQRRLAPAVLKDHGAIEKLRSDGHFPFGMHDAQALSVWELVAFHGQQGSVIRPARFLYLEDAYPATADRAFALRNFGLIRTTISTERAFEKAQVERVKANALSKQELLALTLQSPSGLVTPRDLASLYAPRPYDLDYQQAHRGFQLIVGDTIDEGFLTWNRSLTSSRHVGRDVLWVDADFAREPEFVDSIGNWIRRAFWNNQNQETGSVLSCSEDHVWLTELAARLSKAAWMHFQAKVLPRACFPFRPRAFGGSLHYEALSHQGPRVTEHVAFGHAGGLLTAPTPAFFTGLGTRDGWMVDLDVECTVEPVRYSNRRDSWRLPRRSTLGHLFAASAPQARITRSHLPSIAAASAERTLALRVPSRASLLFALFEAVPTYDSVAERKEKVRSRFQDISTSDEGLRFRAIVDMFGGVASAGRLFDGQFWRNVFLEGSGKPQNDVERLTTVIARELELIVAQLRDQVAASPSVVLDLTTTAKIVARSLRHGRARPATFSRRRLNSLFGQLMSNELISTDSGVRKPRFADHGEHELEWLLAIGALQQGVTLSCPACGTAQWRGVDDLATALRCQACYTEFRLPPTPEWEFRVNGLIQTALTDHGVLSVLNAARQLTDFARHTAIVFAPQELRETYEGPVFTDVDIIVIRDGRFILGEVKSSPEGVAPAQLDRLAAVAQVVRPDEVIVAATGTSWPSDVTAKIQELSTLLAPFDISVTTKLLDW